MVNTKLLKEVTAEKLLTLGFTELEDGSNDPRGTSYIIENKNFYLSVDAWCEVNLSRVNPDTDPIIIHCETLFDLKSVVSWIS